MAWEVLFPPPFFGPKWSGNKNRIVGKERRNVLANAADMGKWNL